MKRLHILKARNRLEARQLSLLAIENIRCEHYPIHHPKLVIPYGIFTIFQFFEDYMAIFQFAQVIFNVNREKFIVR